MCSFTRLVYRRDFVGPKHLLIMVTCEGAVVGEDSFMFTFRVDQPLAKDSKSFEDDLLFNVNLLQENVGAVGVYPSDANPQDYLKTLAVHWEILPPGEDPLPRMVRMIGNPPPHIRKKIEERRELLLTFSPQAWVAGTSGFQRYFGAMLYRDLVVFENLEYGNAIYIMFEDWEVLSQMSRTELLTGQLVTDNGQRFVRIRHAAGWQSKLRKVVNERRREQRV